MILALYPGHEEQTSNVFYKNTRAGLGECGVGNKLAPLTWEPH